MEIQFAVLLAILGSLVLAALAAFFIARSVVRSRSAQAAESARLQAESAFRAEEARLSSELGHARELSDALTRQLEAAREESRRLVQEARDEGARALQQYKEESAAAHRESMAALQERFDETMAKVSAQVKSDTGEMLKARQKEFAESSHLSLGQIVNPLRENIAELKKAMEDGSKEQAERNGEMRERIQSLMEQSEAARKSADELAAAFKHGSKVQGDWGEAVLEELLASQGLTKGVHFDTQATLRDEKGRTVQSGDGALLRPDILLHLDERREVVIDSKVSLTAYVDYVNAETEPARQAALKAHLASIRQHVKELSAKDYSSYIKPPKVGAGYVIMFVPNTGALWTALDAEPSLWRESADKNVYIADEQSLYGALKMVRMTWTQVVQAQNHEKVYALAGEMIERVGMFMEHYEAVGAALRKAKDAYDEGEKKLEDKGRSIITTSRQLIKLGARNSSTHPVRALVDVDDIPALPEAPDQDQNAA